MEQKKEKNMEHVIYNSAQNYQEEEIESARKEYAEVMGVLVDEVSEEDAINYMGQSLYDEEMNLDQELDGDIICIVDLGLWNGRRDGYKMLDSNLNQILHAASDGDIKLYCDNHNVRAENPHHDGTNHILFREVRPGVNIERFKNMIYSGEGYSSSQLNYYTRSLKRYVKEIYGW